MIKATCKSAGTSYGIFLIDRDRLRYLSGSTDKAGLSGAANSLVLWDAIQIGKKMGLSTFDLGGIGIPSIDRFKRGFGGRDVDYIWFYGGSGIFITLISIYEKFQKYIKFRAFR